MTKSHEFIVIPKIYRLVLILLSLVGTSIVLFATSRFGAGISPDSVSYIATARHLAEGIGFISYDNTPLLVQPPLYPSILGMIDYVFGVDPLKSTIFVSTIFFGSTLYLSGLLFLKNFSPYLAFFGTAYLLVSIPLTGVSFMAWSEPSFVFFVVLYLFALSMHAEKKSLKSLALLSSSVALACLTRYIGLVLVLTGLISVLIIRYHSLKLKIFHLLAFVFASILPISIWIGRNYIISKTFFGPRSPSLHTLSENIRFTYSNILLWYLPSQITENRLILALLGFIVGFLMGIIFLWKKHLKPILKETHPFALFVFLLVIGYTGFLIVSSTTTDYDPIAARLLSPIVVPITILLFLVFEILSKVITERFSTKPVEFLIIFSIAIWLLYPTKATVLNAIDQFNNGSGYNTKSWKNSQTIQFIRENKLTNCTIYSNGADVIYLLLNKNVRSISSKSRGANIITDLSSSEITFSQKNRACLIWFDQLSWRTYPFTPEELIVLTDLNQNIQLDDGTIYIVSIK